MLLNYPVECVKARDNLALIGRYHPVLQPTNKPLVVISPAFCASQDDDYKIYGEFASAAASRGYPVARFDFTGLGKSPGEFRETTVSSQINDLETVISKTRKPEEKVVLVGHSLGGVVSSYAARPELGVEAVVFFNSPVNMTRLYGNYASDMHAQGFSERTRGKKKITVGKAMWREFATIKPNKDALQSIPALYVAGSEDLNVNPSAFANAYFSSGERSRIVTDAVGFDKAYLVDGNGVFVVRGADHDFENSADVRRTAISLTLDWLDFHFSK